MFSMTFMVLLRSSYRFNGNLLDIIHIEYITNIYNMLDIIHTYEMQHDILNKLIRYYTYLLICVMFL